MRISLFSRTVPRGILGASFHQMRRNAMIQFLSRTPFTLLGAIGLFSLVSDFMALQEDIGHWIDAWKAVTRPVWDFLLGWLFEWIGWEMPWWVKDYLTLGVIATGMVLRFFLSDPVSPPGDQALFLALAVVSVLIWPIVFVFIVLFLHDGDEKFRLDEKLLFWETGIYFFILIAINYALIFGGATTF